MADKTLSGKVVLSKPVFDEVNKRLTVEAVFAETGVYSYDMHGALYLPQEEIEDKDFIESCQAAPVVDGHVSINPTNVKAMTLGNCYDVSIKNKLLVGKIRVTDLDLIREIVEAKSPVPVSLSYKSRIIKQAGIYNGQRFDGIQTQLKVNHLAIVDDANMPIAAIQNSRNKKMPKLTKLLNLLKNGGMDDEKASKLAEQISNEYEEGEKKEPVENTTHDKPKDDEDLANKISSKMLTNFSKMFNEGMDKVKKDMENKLNNLRNEMAEKKDEDTKIDNSSYAKVNEIRGRVESITNSKLPSNLNTVDEVLDHAANIFVKNGSSLPRSEKMGIVHVLKYMKDANLNNNKPVELIHQQVNKVLQQPETANLNNSTNVDDGIFSEIRINV